MADVSQVINPYAKEVLEGVDESVQNLVLSLLDYDKIAKQIDQGTDLESIGTQVQSFLTEALGVADNLEKVKQLPTDYQEVINTMLGMISQENRINSLMLLYLVKMEESTLAKCTKPLMNSDTLMIHWCRN